MRPEGEVSPSEALALIHLGCVEGIGSPSSLRYLRMVVPEAEAHDRVAERSRDLCRERSRTPEEVRRKMLASRKFTFREHLTEPCPITKQAEWTGLWVYQHKENLK